MPLPMCSSIIETMNETSELDDAASKLCLSCGLCCDGTLFTGLPISDTDNIQPLKAATNKLKNAGEHSKIPFAQSMLKDGRDFGIPIHCECVKISMHGDHSCFEQPCSAYAKQCCQIYTERPPACQEFRCKLLEQYREQKVTLLEAQQKIKRVFSQKTIIREILQPIDPVLAGMSLAKLWNCWDSSAQGDEALAFRQKYGAALMQMAALRWYLQQHFLGERERIMKNEN